MRSDVMRFVCFDIGDKRTGAAVGDDETCIVSPVGMIEATPEDLLIERLASIVETHEPDELVIGLPLNMDGSEGPRCQSTRAFARNLERLTPLPITFWDERLSTVAAERALLEADTSRKRRAEVIDHVAAGYILQGLLDRLTHLRASHDR